MLEMKRVLNAASPAVFAAFSDSNLLAEWFGPQGFTIPSLEFQPRVGETYRIEMQPPEDDPFLPGGGVPRRGSARPPFLHVRLGGS
jgi:uncharacterized protein YndB with AHSA1/START domain